MKTVLFVSLLLVSSSVFSQNKTDSVDGLFSAYGSNTLLQPDSLLGFWSTRDSHTHRIKFTHIHSDFVMKFDSLYTYRFIFSDSNKQIKNQGVMMLWPPSYCYIKLLNRQAIEVYYGTISHQQMMHATFYREE